MSTQAPLRLGSTFAIGSKITLLDAWMRNPRQVRVIKHPDYAPDSVITEDARGVIYTAKTSRIVGEAVTARPTVEDLDDLLGDTPAAEITTEDLLG